MSESDESVEETPVASGWAPLSVGIVALAVGAVLIQQSWNVSGSLSPQEARFFPVMVSVGWLLLAAAYVASVVTTNVRGQAYKASERFDHLPQVIALLVVLVAYAYALDPLGYMIATTVFFAITAAILGSRSHVRDAIIAVGLAVALYFLFSRSLGIYLPAGVLPI